MAAVASKPFRISRGGVELGVLHAPSPLAALADYAAAHNLAGVQQGRSTLAVVGFGLLRAESVAVCGCGPRELADVYWDADSVARCRTCRLPLEDDASRGRDAVLSDPQLAVLQCLCLGGAATAGALLAASGGGPSTLNSLVGLGLVECRTVGARGSLYHLTKFGRDTVCAHQEGDPEEGRPVTSHAAGPLHNKENTIMSTATSETTTMPAAKPKFDFQPLFDELLTKVKEAVADTQEVRKSNYVRVSSGGKTLVYLDFPTSKGVKVSVPKKGGHGYDVIKATTASDVKKALTKIESHAKTLQEATA